jgi:hypothetical protein
MADLERVAFALPDPRIYAVWNWYKDECSQAIESPRPGGYVYLKENDFPLFFYLRQEHELLRREGRYWVLAHSA